MKKKEDILYYDFQGWPVYKKTLREILEGLGFERSSNRGVDYWQIADNDPKLDEYPKVYREDGMGYSSTTEYISEAYVQGKEVILWADEKDKRLEAEERDSNSLSDPER